MGRLMRGTYVMRRGRLVRKRTEPVRATKVHVISDDLGVQLEHHGFDDRRRTDSKSVYRAWTRQAGLVEKGNDRERPRPARAPDITSDVARALQMCKEGYSPSLRGTGSEGWHD